MKNCKAFAELVKPFEQKFSALMAKSILCNSHVSQVIATNKSNFSQKKFKNKISFGHEPKPLKLSRSSIDRWSEFFFELDGEVLKSKTLSAGAKLLYASIKYLTFKKGHTCMKNKELALYHNVSVRSIKRYLNQLVKEGYISITCQRFKGTMFVRTRKIKLSAKTLEGKCTYISSNIMYTTRLSSSEKIFLGLVDSYWRLGIGCYAKVIELAEKFGSHPSTIYRWTRNISDKSFLSIIKTKYKSRVIRTLIPHLNGYIDHTKSLLLSKANLETAYCSLIKKFKRRKLIAKLSPNEFKSNIKTIGKILSNCKSISNEQISYLKLSSSYEDFDRFRSEQHALPNSKPLHHTGAELLRLWHPKLDQVLFKTFGNVTAHDKEVIINKFITSKDRIILKLHRNQWVNRFEYFCKYWRANEMNQSTYEKHQYQKPYAVNDEQAMVIKPKPFHEQVADRKREKEEQDKNIRESAYYEIATKVHDYFCQHDMSYKACYGKPNIAAKQILDLAHMYAITFNKQQQPPVDLIYESAKRSIEQKESINLIFCVQRTLKDILWEQNQKTA